MWFSTALLLLLGVVAVAGFVAVAPVQGAHVDGTRCGGLLAEWLTRDSAADGTCTAGVSPRARTAAVLLGAMIVAALACGVVGRRRLGRNA